MISEREGPTTSPQTNLLINLCQQAMETRSVPEQLVTILESREQGLDQAKMDFVGKIQEQGDQHVQIFQKEIEDVIGAFDGYREALDVVRNYVTRRTNAGELQGAIGILLEVTPRLVAALDAYEAKFMVVGPSQYPIVNIWLKIADTCRRGNMPKENLMTMVNGAREFFKKCVSEMENYPETDVVNAVALLKEGYEIFLSGMDEFEGWAQDQSAAHLDAGLDRIRTSHEKMQQGFDAYKEVKVTGGPTRSPLANTVINGAASLKAGRVTEELFGQSLDVLEDFFSNVKTDFESLAEISSDSASIKETLPKAFEAFALHEEATAQLRQYLADKNPANLDEGVAKLTRAANMIADVEDAFKEIGAIEGKVPCMKCGTPNEDSMRVCSKCGATLPRTERPGVGEASTFQMGEAGQETGEELVMTDNLKRLVEAAHSVAMRKISPEEFVQTLDWMEGLLKHAEEGTKNARNVVPESFPPELRDDAIRGKELVDDTKSLFLASIEDFRAGLDEMRHFLDDGDKTHLREGLKAVWEAAKVVFQVKKIGEEVSRQVAAQEEAASGSPQDADDEVEIARAE